LVAIFTVWRVRLAAGRASCGHRTAALVAKPGRFQIVCFTGRTFHKLGFTCISGNILKDMI
jgi:hypothetical protein